MRRFDDLTDPEVLALAIASEEEDSRIYLNFAAKLRATYPASARAFEAMAAEEQDHRRRLLQTYSEKFGEELPYITRQDVKGFLKRNPIWLLRDLRLDAIRKQAELMEFEAGQFYAKAADRTKDVRVRALLTDLAEAEHKHITLAASLEQTTLTTDAKTEEEVTAKRLFLLQVVQPGLAGLIDGSVSTLAPIFAAAFATQNSWNTFLVGLAASIGAGISMGLTEALSDDGEITDRGHPWLRGSICGVMTAIGGLGHTLPYLIPNFWTATIAAMIVVAIELFAIAWIRWRYMETPFTSAIIQVVLGGILVLVTGIFIGSA
ncbi:rubrerythrin [Bradyrhizobium diazoefficiens]|jgi:erythrin-vacuolar iron transport family protein|nr:ferritin family protein [Bradyrhizobium diazoefficiens]MBR0963803.1 rubrerythrin [Bradyrhizobium diazoefficiens]MBR0977954.1 rubrerythrin [Bradyrhizobium diazoefficiens]MBR1007464.1 rubrerythrin [Bradyrhizobium diazoefficiens]MBR1012694.1 rubrerythrin [Bradyrhizobium diazoefficiens]MBR1051551.1 rubrerythrin [Bradyrhizobium diazoefficiens]